MSENGVDRQNDVAASRPDLPESYGILEPSEGSGLLPWEHVSRRMTESRNYWIVTVWPNGRPHAAPVWGIWLDETFYFGTGRESRKARNLATTPDLVVHLESGDDVVILEGIGEEVTDSDRLSAYADAYEAKYDFRPDTSDDATVTYRLRPQVAFAWFEDDYVGSATRWHFE